MFDLFSHHIDHQSTCSDPSTPQLFQPYSKRNNPSKPDWTACIANLRDKIPTPFSFLIKQPFWLLSSIEPWRWPILIEDEQYTPMFIRRFHPDQVIRLPSVAPPLASEEQRLQSYIWHGIQQGESQTWKRLGRPPGV